MQRRFLQVGLLQIGLLQIIAIVLGMSLAAHGQSLGDIARANREKQNSSNAPTTPPAVITNDEIDMLPQGGVTQRRANAAVGNNNKSLRATAGQAPIDERAAAQWKRQIVAQQDKLATLQARMDRLNAAIHPEGSAEFNGPYTRAQTVQQERLAEVQLQFNEQKKKLAEMQEEARRAGMHTAVYDP